MSYDLSLTGVAQIATLTYACSPDTPAMRTAVGREFRPDHLLVAMRRHVPPNQAESGDWSVATVRVSGPALDQPPGGQRRCMRTFYPARLGAPEVLPPWFDTLLTHAVRKVTDEATLLLPAPADTVTA